MSYQLTTTYRGPCSTGVCTVTVVVNGTHHSVDVTNGAMADRLRSMLRNVFESGEFAAKRHMRDALGIVTKGAGE